MSSLLDVARLAGVSKTLVSRVVNHQPGVSSATRQKILDAMETLHYQPNALARSLVTHKTMTIGVVMDSLVEPYFFPMIEGIEEAVEPTAYDVVFTSGRNSIKHKQTAVQYFTQGRADGLLIYGSQLEDDAIVRDLAQHGFPFVVIENTFPTLDINNIALDSQYGSGLAVDYLMKCGCRRICHVSGGSRHRVSMDRMNGYLEAMRRHGIPAQDAMVIEADFALETSYRIMLEWLSGISRDQLPDGFYCGSDNTAYGVIRALTEAGYRVPEDTMVIGFDDDTPPQDYHGKTLTTLAQPLKKMGASAVELLLRNIEQPDSQRQRISYYPTLVKRGTTKEKTKGN